MHGKSTTGGGGGIIRMCNIQVFRYKDLYIINIPSTDLANCTISDLCDGTEMRFRMKTKTNCCTLFTKWDLTHTHIFARLRMIQIFLLVLMDLLMRHALDKLLLTFPQFFIIRNVKSYTWWMQH